MRYATEITIKKFESSPSFIVMQQFLDGYVCEWLGFGNIAAVTDDTFAEIQSVYPRTSVKPASNGFPWKLSYLGQTSLVCDSESGKYLERVHLFKKEGDRLADMYEEKSGEEGSQF